MITTIFRKRQEDLPAAGVDALVSVINRVIKEKGTAVLAIPGGRSVAGIWSRLSLERRIDWCKVHIFMADERVVPPTHEESNYRLAYQSFIANLISSGLLPSENVHAFSPDGSSDRGLSRYNAELVNLGGSPDVLILGVGEDGHVGALYPNHHSVDDESSGYIMMDDSPKPPPERITMSRSTMLSANTIMLLFIGEGKRDAYEAFKSGTKISECPARIGKKVDGCYVLTDLQ